MKRETLRDDRRRGHACKFNNDIDNSVYQSQSRADYRARVINEPRSSSTVYALVRKHVNAKSSAINPVAVSHDIIARDRKSPVVNAIANSAAIDASLEASPSGELKYSLNFLK